MSNTRKIVVNTRSATTAGCSMQAGPPMLYGASKRQQFRIPSQRSLVLTAVESVLSAYPVRALPAADGEGLLVGLEMHPVRRTLYGQVRPLGLTPQARHYIEVTSELGSAGASSSGEVNDWLNRHALGRQRGMGLDLWFEAICSRFANQIRDLESGRQISPAYSNAIDKLLAQIAEVQNKVTKALPQVINKLRQHYPDASLVELYQASLQAIDEQLTPVLNTLYLWVAGIRQKLDPRYSKPVSLLEVAAEQGLMLLLTGQLSAKTQNIQQIVNTIHLKVGDLVMVVLTDPLGSGPAVIPITGDMGPEGAHLMMFPFNLQRFLVTLAAIYCHEKGHVMEANVVGLTDELIEKIGRAIDGGSFDKLTEEVEIAPGQSIPIGLFLKKLFIDEHGELFADLIGNLMAGPQAFTYDFASYIKALVDMIRSKGRIGKAGSVDDKFLRTDSSYGYDLLPDGSWELGIEAHPIDMPRMSVWQATIAEFMGYPAAADEAREIAAAHSTNQPKISWHYQTPETGESDDGSDGGASDGSPKPPEGKTITLSVELWKRAAAVVLKALTTEPFESLGGLTLPELVNLTPQLDAKKVEPIVEHLVTGAPLPAGFLPFHFIGAAAVRAVVRILKADRSKDAFAVETAINEAAIKIMEAQLPMWKEMQARVDPRMTGQAASAAGSGARHSRPARMRPAA